jgi:hypothetical protein
MKQRWYHNASELCRLLQLSLDVSVVLDDDVYKREKLWSRMHAEGKCKIVREREVTSTLQEPGINHKGERFACCLKSFFSGRFSWSPPMAKAGDQREAVHCACSSRPEQVNHSKRVVSQLSSEVWSCLSYPRRRRVGTLSG